ncbi:hypothetical protein AmDm5_2743 [Acetobacter malorum]|nr:hypothetical protein AmDm5_2743 [Acetobacter malorum]
MCAKALSSIARSAENFIYASFLHDRPHAGIQAGRDLSC